MSELNEWLDQSAGIDVEEEIAARDAEITRLRAALLYCDELSQGDEGRINYLTSALGLYDISGLLTDEHRAEFMKLMYRDMDGDQSTTVSPENPDMPCPTCKGDGYVEATASVDCPTCCGTGSRG